MKAGINARLLQTCLDFKIMSGSECVHVGDALFNAGDVVLIEIRNVNVSHFRHDKIEEKQVSASARWAQLALTALAKV
jgi:hypothetical protein